MGVIEKNLWRSYGTLRQIGNRASDLITEGSSESSETTLKHAKDFLSSNEGKVTLSGVLMVAGVSLIFVAAGGDITTRNIMVPIWKAKEVILSDIMHRVSLCKALELAWSGTLLTGIGLFLGGYFTRKEGPPKEPCL